MSLMARARTIIKASMICTWLLSINHDGANCNSLLGGFGGGGTVGLLVQGASSQKKHAVLPAFGLLSTPYRIGSKAEKLTLATN